MNTKNCSKLKRCAHWYDQSILGKWSNYITGIEQEKNNNSRQHLQQLFETNGKDFFLISHTVIQTNVIIEDRWADSWYRMMYRHRICNVLFLINILSRFWWFLWLFRVVCLTIIFLQWFSCCSIFRNELQKHLIQWFIKGI